MLSSQFHGFPVRFSVFNLWFRINTDISSVINRLFDKLIECTFGSSWKVCRYRCVICESCKSRIYVKKDYFPKIFSIFFARHTCNDRLFSSGTESRFINLLSDRSMLSSWFSFSTMRWSNWANRLWANDRCLTFRSFANASNSMFSIVLWASVRLVKRFRS